MRDDDEAQRIRRDDQAWEARRRERLAAVRATLIDDADLAALDAATRDGDLAAPLIGCDHCGALRGDECRTGCPESDPWGQHWPPM